MKKVTLRVWERLEKLKKSQKEMAEFMGVSENGLSKMIKRGTFDSKYLEPMQEFLKVDPSFFMEHSNWEENHTDVVLPDQISKIPEENCEARVEALLELLKHKDELLDLKDQLIEQLKLNAAKPPPKELKGENQPQEAVKYHKR